MKGKGIIDVHTHVYLPRYLNMLRERSSLPRVFTSQGKDRLVILPGEDQDPCTAQGRPIGPEYSSPATKLSFMNTHSIGTSVLSLANPWLDFLPPAQASSLATDLNQDLQELCHQHPGSFKGFAVLPSTDLQGSLRELERIQQLPDLRGVILGTKGLGQGLGDRSLFPLFEALQDLQLTAFIHPHYGLGSSFPPNTGHVLSLGLGFPFETSASVASLILAGVLDHFPRLSLLLAHAGGTLPFLAGRLDSCLEADTSINLEALPSAYLQRMSYDGICYNSGALKCLVENVGVDNVLFGTDHPFFPPPGVSADQEGALWPSTLSNYDVLRDSRLSPEDQDKILFLNAWRLLGLETSNKGD